MLYSSRTRSLLTFTFALTLGATQVAAQTGGGGSPAVGFFGSTGPLPLITVSGVSIQIPYLVYGDPSTTCSIDNGVGAVPCSVNGNPATLSISPSVTTTYTLTATNSYGSVTAQTTVVVVQLPPNPPGPGLFTTLPGKNYKQSVLPPQYHFTFATVPGRYQLTRSGDSGLASLVPGSFVDARGNMLSIVTSLGLGGSVFLGSTAYLYDPNGARSVFGTTSATCTQSGPLATNEYTMINSVGYNPVALAYYATTTHTIQTIYTTNPNLCNPNSNNANSFVFLAGSTTQALIKISAGSDIDPGD
jgi:hypothetical protein